MTKLPSNGNGSSPKLKIDLCFYYLNKVLKHVFTSSMTLVQIAFIGLILTIIIGLSIFICSQVRGSIKSSDVKYEKLMYESHIEAYQESITRSQAIREAIQTERTKALYLQDLDAGFQLPPIEDVISEVEQNVELHSND